MTRLSSKRRNPFVPASGASSLAIPAERWGKTLPRRWAGTDSAELGIKVGIVLGLAVVAILTVLTWGGARQVMQAMRQNTAAYLAILAGQAMLAIAVGTLMWRFYLAWRYCPAEAASDKELPLCTVIVPAYNEGKHVLATLQSLVRSDYPPDKLRIIAIDDGSVDDTWLWMRRAAAAFPGRIKLIRQGRNTGKRCALRAGFLQSVGQVVVTVDSDSTVGPQTLRRLVSPFRDPKVGAVAGNIRVLNASGGIIPKMLDVSFQYSFQFVRASQSVVNTVMCTPGALSAYRRHVVLQVLPGWLNQTFCGRPATIGEDRALTNMILQRGYHVHFQSDAVAYTNVPTAYKSLCRMFLRWARSNVRETIMMTQFIFSKFREAPASGARVNLLVHWLHMTLPVVVRALAFACLLMHPVLFSIQIAAGALLSAVVPALLYAARGGRSDALWAFPYSVFWLVGLSWIAPYSLITPYKSSWLTRQIPRPDRPPVATAGPAAIPPLGRAAAS